jgi:poly(A) polymerase
MTTPEEQRRFAVEVVRRLQAAGFTAYWAGGCVRDQLLGRTPKDYDVATDAVPEQIRRLFGRRRTLAIGAAFGVISVVGPKPAGLVEVTTFRQDAAYSDGRHPDRVTFSTPEEDAQRRDFTINGLFYDPTGDRVLDFVGGREDLENHLIRAIGDARQRFAEDKLRMLRAVRFAATFDFAIDPATRRSIAAMASEIGVVSPERIAAEMRRMLSDSGRAAGVRLLVETGLAAEILPEIVPRDDAGRRTCGTTLELLARLAPDCGFPAALAAALHPCVDAAVAAEVCRCWRLSNKERERVCWLVEHFDSLAEAKVMPWSAIQPLLVAEGIDDLLAITAVAAPAGAEAAAHCRRLLEQPRDALDPPPLATGDDLQAAGVPAGPRYKEWLQRLRAAQLDGQVRTKAEALAMVERWREERGEGRGERGE